MDISGLSIGMSQMAAQSQVNISLMKMNMDSGKEAMGDVAKMIEDVAVDTKLGTMIDSRA